MVTQLRTWSNIMNKNKTFRTIAAAAAIAAGTIALASSADARTYGRHHHYGYGLRGAYGQGTTMYGAGHYRRRPYQRDTNPDFELGGNRS
jgi:hypothetical protein